ncbi:unnamed protein product, partial [Musa textilis]
MLTSSQGCNGTGRGSIQPLVEMTLCSLTSCTPQDDSMYVSTHL